jgi:tetratricopeptide (TPR) repeat protein
LIGDEKSDRIESRMKQIRRLFLIFCVLFSGCSALERHYLVAKGNYDYSRGDYQQANIAYLRALENREYEELLAYNLGNTYSVLGEAEAALEEWEISKVASEREVTFRTHFNTGCLLYDLGRYSEAYSEFREALVLYPGSREAKINLEYALLKLQGADDAPAVSPAGEQDRDEAGRNEETNRILEYVRRKELELWESGSTNRPDEPADDW